MTIQDEVRALLAAATPGPWYWRNTHHPMLLGGRSMLVMSFERMGVQGAQPLFRDEHNIMQPGGRANLNGFPDAALIARAPELLAALCDKLDKAEMDRDLFAAINREMRTAELNVELQAEREAHSAAIARAEKAEAAIQRVRAVHRPSHSCEMNCPPEDLAICDHQTCCDDCMAGWPCPTITALDGE